LIAAFAGFGWFTARKLSIVSSLRPEVRWDRPGDRFLTVVRNGFMQSRMIRGEWRPGVMHAVIFLGFLALLARKLQLIAIGYDETVAFGGIVGGMFAAGKDVVEAGVLAACGYAFYRRFVIKPRRLEPNREALLVLGLIVAIMLSDLAFDAFRFALLSGEPAIAHERAYAFLGDGLARAVAGWPRPALDAGYVLSYWTQMVVVLSFLVILPLGEHFHIVTALPALFFRRGRPANVVPKVDLEAAMSGDDTAMQVGARTALDLTWKEGLDAFTCTECGRCKDACPTFLTGKPLTMKWVNDSLKHHLVASHDAILATDAESLPALVPDVIGEDTLWACTTCGYCEAACPIELEHLPRFFRLRQHRVMMEGIFPADLKRVFAAYEVQGNPWGLPPDTRADWAEAAGVPVLRSPAEVAGLDYLFYVGSAESFDPRGQRIATAFAKVLRSAGVKVAILGAREGSTGECVRRAGNEMLFQQLAQSLIATFEEFGIRRIVTCDPHAFNTLKNEYPEFGGHYEVIHHTQLIEQLLAAGRIRVDARLERVIYHEPCYLGRHNGEYEAPRAILRRLTRDAPLEFELSRERSMCCGAGGGRMWLEEKIGKRINVARVEQALPHAPAVIATACPYCAVMMADGVSALNAEPKTKDIAELVAEALV